MTQVTATSFTTGGNNNRKLNRSPSSAITTATDLGYQTLSHSSYTSGSEIMMMKPISDSRTKGSSVASNFTSSSLTKSYNMKHTKKKMTRKTSPFEKLTDEIIVKIFSKLSSDELCASCPQVCRRWYSIIWGSPDLWTQITFSDNPVVHVDMGLKSIFKLLSRDACSRQVPSFSSADDSLYLNYFSLKRASSGTSPFGYDSIPVQTFRITSVNNSESLTDRGLMLVARKCSNLKTLQLKSCPHVSNLGLSEILAKCWKIRKLDVTGCANISLNTSNKSMENHPKLRYLDISDCQQIDDYTLRKFLKLYGPQLKYFYARKNCRLTDESIEYLVSSCPQIKEISLNECIQISDRTCIELASKIGVNLKYLSLAKCERITDDGLKQMSRFCFKLRYLNVRGCESVSDDGVASIARSCGPRLKALDAGKCDISDEGLKILSENCPNLKKLSIRECDLISDTGISLFAYYCRNLIHLNIVECPNITREAFLYIRRCCKFCIIHHTNPNFY